LAAYLRKRGIDVPPADADFWYAIKVWAINHGAHLPEFSRKPEGEKLMLADLLELVG
jgi:hypothetical protein